jgi:hypothetical protein
MQNPRATTWLKPEGRVVNIAKYLSQMNIGHHCRKWKSPILGVERIVLRDVFLASIFLAYVEPKLFFRYRAGKFSSAAPTSSLTTDQPPSLNDNDNGASDANHSAPAPDNIRPQQTSPAPLVMEGVHFEEQDDDAPVPPEMIAASFEAMKPELINEDDALVHDDQIAALFEAQDDEEEKREEDEDGDAPLPPEMIAASFEEACTPEFINEDDAPAPPDMISGAFEGYDNEEEKQEEDEDRDAPLPPEMIAELFEASDDVKQKAAKIPRMIEARTD